MPTYSYYNKNPNDRTDLNGFTPVSAMMSFNSKGEFIPIYFQVETEDDKILYKIDAIKRTNKKFGAVQFECYITEGNRRREISLYYLVSRSLWAIKK